jgi:predicted nuclease with RNAse H fold
LKSVIVGIDLAGASNNPTGWAVWINKRVSACHLYDDEQILKCSTECEPDLIAIDSPLSLPKEGAMRKADKEMYKRGYPVFPPRFPAMERLTLRAMKLTQQMVGRGLKVIEVHPASTRKALKMPTKDWNKIQEIFIRLGLKGDIETRALTPHEIDAVTASLTGYLHLQGKIESVGNHEEGYIVVPVKVEWRKLRL